MNKFLPALVLAMFTFASPLLQASELIVSKAWIREAPPVSKVQAAYMLISNPTDKPVALIAATSPLYSKIEFHRTVMDNGVMRMLQEDSLSIPAKGEIHLQPEGAHMMLFNPKKVLMAGDNVPFTLTFSEQQKIDIMIKVKKAQGTTQKQHRCGHHE